MTPELRSRVRGCARGCLYYGGIFVALNVALFAGAWLLGVLLNWLVDAGVLFH